VEHIKKSYKETFRKYGDSPCAVQWPKGRQVERFDALTSHFNKNETFSVLDFGCGLAHLKEYLSYRYKSFNYIGVDVVDDFINSNKKKFSDSEFITPDELFHNNQLYDYVIISGTFNILYQEDVDKHKMYVLNLLSKLFQKTNKYISVNFMTDQVDFIQEKSFHINPIEVYDFFRNHLSKRILINQSYMPYEFTITVWKDDFIIKPDNIYNKYD
jgi:SAM-dependent methyltransferase